MYAQALKSEISSSQDDGYRQFFLQINRFKKHSQCQFKKCLICSNNRIVYKVVYATFQQMSIDQRNEFCVKNSHLTHTLRLILSTKMFSSNLDWNEYDTNQYIIDMMDLQIMKQRLSSWFKNVSFDTILKLEELCNAIRQPSYKTHFASELQTELVELSLPVSPTLLDAIYNELVYINQLHPSSTGLPTSTDYRYYNYTEKRLDYSLKYPKLILQNIRRHIVVATRKCITQKFHLLNSKLQIKMILNKFIPEDGIIRSIFSY